MRRQRVSNKIRLTRNNLDLTRPPEDILIPAQARAARAYLDWTITQTAKAANVSQSSITKVEGGYPVNIEILLSLRTCFWKHGLRFKGKGFTVVDITVPWMASYQTPDDVVSDFRKQIATQE